jgi:hypothetical protein
MVLVEHVCGNVHMCVAVSIHVSESLCVISVSVCASVCMNVLRLWVNVCLLCELNVLCGIVLCVCCAHVLSYVDVLSFVDV